MGSRYFVPGGIKCQSYGTAMYSSKARSKNDLPSDYYLEQNDSRFIQKAGKAMK